MKLSVTIAPDGAADSAFVVWRGIDVSIEKAAAYSPICEYALSLGVTILIEPVNRYEINFINFLDEGAALMEKCQFPNCKLMPDVFHMNIEDDNINGSLTRNAKWIGYIHFADSNRLAPGWAIWILTGYCRRLAGLNLMDGRQ
ncbi:MAG: sugar phosphate isomerase/epimerase [Clostridiales bacterium]|jgi:sugar phosphate isomerase/epimerase|nr:sugar phosphate isomerase/epimerase [Clostridiales bacterium]